MKQHADVIVIGGGVIGVCTAYYLLAEGRQVTILERGKVCSGSSYGNSGLIVPGHSLPLTSVAATKFIRWMFDPDSPVYVRPRFSRNLFSWLRRLRAATKVQKIRDSVRVLGDLSQLSIALYDHLIRTEKIECGYSKSGVLMLYKTAHGYDEGLSEARLTQEHGIPMKEMTSSEVREIDPQIKADIAGAIYHEDDAHLDPAAFVNCLAERVSEKGGIIREGSEVLGFDTSDNKIITVNTAQQVYNAEQVVLAAGSWSSGLAHHLNIDLPLQPVKGYSVTIDLGPESLVVPVMLPEVKIGVNPMATGMRIAGTLEMSGDDLSINIRRINAMLRAAGDYLRHDMQAVSMDSAWAGLRPCMPDGLPVIGTVSSPSNLVVATGHAMLGMTLGPITGKLVAQIISGQRTMLDISELKVERFK